MDTTYPYDLDGDGDLDFLASAFIDGVYWLEQDMENDEWFAHEMDSWEDAYSFLVADITGDGSGDVLSADNSSVKRWYEEE